MCPDCTITLVSNPSIALSKDGEYVDFNNDGITNVGDQIVYHFKVVNLGNVALANVTITDPMVTVTGGPITLAAGASDTTTFKANYTLTAADISAQGVYNLATVSGLTPSSSIVSKISFDPTPIDPTTCTICLPIDPKRPTATINELDTEKIAVIKTGVFHDDNNDGFAQAGETITYSFSVTNLGTVPLTNVTITDPLPGVVVSGGPIPLLDINDIDSTTFTAVYHITQAEITSGRVSNQAIASGITPIGGTVTDKSDHSSYTEDNPTIIEVDGCKIEIFNGVSDNGDEFNKQFYIRGLECYPNNNVSIFNRWGVLVFERDGYNNDDKAFKGISEGRATINKSERLPVGTYFYTFKYVDFNGMGHEKAGYLYLNR